MSILFYDRPLKHGAAVRSELGLREDGTMRRSVADRRLHGGSLSIGSPISVPCRPGGRNPQKGTHPREGVLNLPIPGILVPGVLLICADGSRQSCSPGLSVIPLPNSARDQASEVGVGTGSACGGVTRERRRLCLVFVDPEGAARIGLG